MTSQYSFLSFLQNYYTRCKYESNTKRLDGCRYFSADHTPWYRDAVSWCDVADISAHLFNKHLCGSVFSRKSTQRLLWELAGIPTEWKCRSLSPLLLTYTRKHSFSLQLVTLSPALARGRSKQRHRSLSTPRSRVMLTSRRDLWLPLLCVCVTQSLLV